MDEIRAILIRGSYIKATYHNNLHNVFRRQIVRLWEEWIERVLRSRLK